jgi:hypothetical protein
VTRWRVNSTLDRAVSAQRGGSGGLTPLPSLRVMAWGPPSPPLADPSPLENGRDDFLVLLSRPQRADDALVIDGESDDGQRSDTEWLE